jgi:hypothetical protein
MYKEFVSFLDSKTVLYKHHYDFRGEHSTIHPILHLINQCAEANNTIPKQHTKSIFCDLSKAFDVINPDIRFITLGGRSAHLAYHVYKSGRKTSIIIIRYTLNQA